ncbi:MAG: inorganic diphosphatase [Candidatus Buchananbacteria bacterium]|nr:inorganic diphosphatase [Candidatus Buchananbacteria bacterium]
MADSTSTALEVIIEIPRGSRNKYEMDHERHVIKFDRMLYSAVHYPSDYGFIPETLGQDGDPLDALVLLWEPTFPGCLIECEPIGVFKMIDGGEHDEKIVCVPVADPLTNHMTKLADVQPHLLKEIEHFFSTYKELEGKKVEVEGWGDRAEAEAIIKDCRERYQKQK